MSDSCSVFWLLLAMDLVLRCWLCLLLKLGLFDLSGSYWERLLSDEYDELELEGDVDVEELVESEPGEI